MTFLFKVTVTELKKAGAVKKKKKAPSQCESLTQFSIVNPHLFFKAATLPSAGSEPDLQLPQLPQPTQPQAQEAKSPRKKQEAEPTPELPPLPPSEAVPQPPKQPEQPPKEAEVNTAREPDWIDD